MEKKRNRLIDAIISAFGYSFVLLSVENMQNPYVESAFLFAGILFICLGMYNMILYREHDV